MAKLDSNRIDLTLTDAGTAIPASIRHVDFTNIMNHESTIISAISLVSVLAAIFSVYYARQANKYAKAANLPETRMIIEQLLNEIKLASIGEGYDQRNKMLMALSYENYDDPRWGVFPQPVKNAKSKLYKKLSEPGGNWSYIADGDGVPESSILISQLIDQMKTAIRDTYQSLD